MTEIVPIVVVHGGAGAVATEKRAVHVEGCKRAAAAGLQRLRDGASALDAAQRAVEVLEDDPLFNAGTGGSLTSAGTLELDAAIMEGTDLRAGAVAVLPPFANPVRVARAVLEDGRHVMYAGEQAAVRAERLGLQRSTFEAMCTPAALERLQQYRQGNANEEWAGGTVGAVACDPRGRVAAATSTGGTVGKQPGRVGDTPLIGAGTYADDDAGACSATGVGETIIRTCLGRATADLMRRGVPAPEATRAAVAEFGRRVAGRGGIIALDRHGTPGFAWNTDTMSYAVARGDEPVQGGC